MPKPKTLIPVKNSKYGKIFETNCFKDGVYFIEKYKASNRFLALFDIDNTIVSFRHTLGTDQWFDFDFNEFIQQGNSAEDAKRFTLSLYLEYIKKIHSEDVYAVEEDTPAVIRDIQKMGIDAMALTSRGLYLLSETIEQLNRFEIDFNQGSHRDKSKVLPQTTEGKFTQGMILTDGKHKGECLFSCFEDMLVIPEFIIMWDDKLHNLEKVQEVIDKYNEQKSSEAKEKDAQFKPIRFIGIRYSKLDHLKKVSPQIVELQKKYFQRILSDEHAAMILHAESKKLRRNYVDIDYQPQKEFVIISLCKPATYQLLKDIEPSVDHHRIMGGIKTFNQKDKLAWQFQYSIAEFQTLFHKLSQHGLIEPTQYDALSPIFIPSNVYTPKYQQLGQIKSAERLKVTEFVPEKTLIKESSAALNII